MSALLVTHARAKRRSAWDRADALRPLAAYGQEQARALVGALAGHAMERVIAAPLLRCLETVEPLAAARSLELEADARLLGDPAGALELIAACDEAPIALCAPREIALALLRSFAAAGVRMEAPIGAEEAGTWFLQDLGGTDARARYLPPPELPEGERPRVAVLELGSTSLHLVVYEILAGGRVDRLDQHRVMLRGDRRVADAGVVQDETAKHALEAARELRAFAEENRAQRLIAIARPEYGAHESGRELARGMSGVIGSEVRVQTLQEHVQALFRSARERLSLGVMRALAFDLGAVNLELAIGDEREITLARAFPLGVVRLRDELVRSDPPSEAEQRALRERVWKAMSPHLSEIFRPRPARCVGSGGTIGALARMVPARGEREEGLFLSRQELEALEQRLCSVGFEERLRIRGIDARRVELLPTAAVVLGTVADALGLVGFAVSDWGVSEGIALAAD
jgi:exopolyphosphatase/guanosine-5'-triphosphate,3'-diphosphate pyrophosphatase